MKKIIFILLVMSGLGMSAVARPLRQTVVSIIGENFYINGQPTYAGRVWNGHRVEGLLLNTRMVQATFDDLNPTTAARGPIRTPASGTRNAMFASLSPRCRK